MIEVIEHDDRFRPGASLIPGGGLGLFAAKPIKAGDFLEVVGVMVRRGAATDLCTAYADRYKFLSSDGSCLVVPMGWAGLINHTDDKMVQNAEIRNVKAKGGDGLGNFVHYTGEVVYYFIKDVAVGEEIYGNYGKGFSSLNEAISHVKESLGQDPAWNALKSMGLYDLDRLDEMLGRQP